MHTCIGSGGTGDAVRYIAIISYTFSRWPIFFFARDAP